MMKYGKTEPCRKRHGRKKRKGMPVGLLLLGLFLVGFFLGHGLRQPQTTGAEPVTTESGEMLTKTDPQPHTQVASNSAPPDDWRLTLVNGDHLFQNDRQIPLTELDNGLSVDTRCYPDLQAMMDDCRAAGLSPIICSAYRTVEYQQTLYDNKVASFLAQGLSQKEAEAEAGHIVALPGTSEHHLGLAMDIVDESYQILDEGQENTAVQKWLMENSWRYGFVLRYPCDKGDITGIIYEPWHYRYVGKAAAKEMFQQGICLEEYLQGTFGT